MYKYFDAFTVRQVFANGRSITSQAATTSSMAAAMAATTIMEEISSACITEDDKYVVQVSPNLCSPAEEQQLTYADLRDTLKEAKTMTYKDINGETTSIWLSVLRIIEG